MQLLMALKYLFLTVKYLHEDKLNEHQCSDRSLLLTISTNVHEHLYVGDLL
jgi:hypothetical protein